MLKIKKNILYNIIGVGGKNIKESIKSCLTQQDINPYIFVHATDKLFYEAKEECVNPYIYEPGFIRNKNVCVAKFTDERNAIGSGIKFGLDNNCSYFCFLHVPCQLDLEFTKRGISCIKDENIGCYTNIIDGNIEIYTSINSFDHINIGPCFIIKRDMVGHFSHNLIGDFIKHCMNFGIFHHIPEFLVKTDWMSLHG